MTSEAKMDTGVRLLAKRGNLICTDGLYIGQAWREFRSNCGLR